MVKVLRKRIMYGRISIFVEGIQLLNNNFERDAPGPITNAIWSGCCILRAADEVKQITNDITQSIEKLMADTKPSRNAVAAGTKVGGVNVGCHSVIIASTSSAGVS